MKECPRCHIEKPEKDFTGKLCSDCYHKNYGGRNKTRDPNYRKNYHAAYYQNNREQMLASATEYYQQNKDRVLEYQTLYRENNPEKRKAWDKKYRGAHKTQIQAYLNTNKQKVSDRNRKWRKDKRQNDPVFRLRKSVSNIVGLALKKTGGNKKGSSVMSHLPYNIQELKNHLEQQFELWMSWDNHGKYNSKTWNDNDTSTWTWNIDHIIPQSKLSYTSMTDENFQKCWALSNLRPLSAKANVSEGNRR